MLEDFKKDLEETTDINTNSNNTKNSKDLSISEYSALLIYYALLLWAFTFSIYTIFVSKHIDWFECFVFALSFDMLITRIGRFFKK